MNTKDTIDTLKYHFNIKMGLFKSVVELLERGEVNSQIADKFDKWLKKQKLHTNLEDVRDKWEELKGGNQ